MKQCFQANKAHQPKLEAYETAYKAVFGLTKLISTLESQEFCDQMNRFGLLPPDLFKKFLYEVTKREEPSFHEFAQRILDNPSPQMMRLKEKIERLSA
jgi:hypothetical protein